jgi:hypothetical protein
MSRLRYFAGMIAAQSFTEMVDDYLLSASARRANHGIA